MKKILLSLLLTGMTIGLFSAEMKIAYIDSEKILAQSEDAKAAQKLFEVDKGEWEAKVRTFDDEIEELKDDYNNRKLTLTDAGKQEAEDRINQKIQARKQYLEGIFGEQGLAYKRNQELLEPILGKLKRIIEELSNEKSIDIVFDASTSGIVYAVPKLDITDDVIDRMNKETE